MSQLLDSRKKHGAHAHKRLAEAAFIASVAVAAFFLVALISYHSSDPAWSLTSSTGFVANIEGHAGAWLADISLFTSGYIAYLLPLILVQLAWVCTRGKDVQRPRFSALLALIGTILFVVSLCGLASLHLPDNQMLPIGSGGLIGQSVAWNLLPIFGVFGSTLTLSTLFVISISLSGSTSWCLILNKLYQGLNATQVWLRQTIKARYHQTLDSMTARRAKAAEKKAEKAAAKGAKPTVRKQIESLAKPVIKSEPKPEEAPKQNKSARIAPKILAEVAPAVPTTAEGAEQIVSPALPKTDYLPQIDILDPVPTKKAAVLNEVLLQDISENVQSRLKDFSVDAKVVAVQPGPVITRYELQLAPGTKVSKIVGLSKDLARSLSVPSVRVVEVIPGKSVIGLELPNDEREMVCLREVLDSEAYKVASSGLSLALGKDIGGHSVVVDLAKMPHLLVAGTTGSGKSVSLNAMLLSLLYKSTPDQLRLIMIDPKMLELAIYDGIPHLLTPVVTDMRDASNALRWCVAEMERRYALMAAMRVRNIAGYNRKIAEAKAAGKVVHDPTWAAQTGEVPPELDELPQIMVLVDEFADLMMVVGKKLEQLIARLAQKARAAGIHLILATQRPSVDVITGLIKANIPTRIAFQVSSRIDSRTILDQQGAEQLLGHGDMLYLPAGAGVPIRVHGAFVSDEEVNRVVESIKSQAEPQYVDGITGGSDLEAAMASDTAGDFDDEKDELYDQAVQIVVDTRRASISNVQRRLKIGYNRAARLIEAMEAAGLVSGMESNGTREVLIPKQDEGA